MSSPAPRPGILDIIPYVAGSSGVEGLAKVAKLSSNESPLGPSPLAIGAYHKAADALERYPDSGATALREALGQKHGLDPARIVCSGGSEQVLDCLIRAYAGPGDEVLFNQHGFIVYFISAVSAGAAPVKAVETDFTADVDALLDAVTDRTRVVCLANPNNPTGTYLPAAEVRRLRAGLPAHILLILDAAYAEYVDRDDYDAGASLVEQADGNVVMTRTFSKIYGLAALRIGWAYCPAEVAAVVHRVRGAFNVSGPAQAAAVAALGDAAFTARAKAHNDRWLPWLAREISALGLQTSPSIGNFLLIHFPNGAGQAQAADRHLRARGVILRPVAAYGLGQCLRATVGLEQDNRAIIAGLKSFLSG
ncbi:MAG: pyridoxal phosphate-dependent aminotransferase [Sphingomonadales bacterium]